MNLENLKIMHDYLLANRETIEPNFNIGWYRSGSRSVHKCDSIGCVLGHGVGAFHEDAIPLIHTLDIRRDDFEINFIGFALHFFDLKSGSEPWSFLFGGVWRLSEDYKTFNAALSRLKWVIEGNDYRDHEQYLTFEKLHNELR